MPEIAGVVYDDQLWGRAESLLNQAYADLARDIAGEGNAFGQVRIYVSEAVLIEKTREIYEQLVQPPCGSGNKGGGT
jgi:hypothetical protein